MNDNFVWEKDGKLVVTGSDTTLIYTYPELAVIPERFEKRGTEDCFTVYERKMDLEPATAVFEKIEEDEGGAVYTIDISYEEMSEKDVKRDIILWIDYDGYGMDVYDKDDKINDHFYTGQLVPISLKYFGFPRKLTVKIKVLRKDDWVYIEKWPELIDGRVCRLNAVTVTEEYQ